MFPKRLRPELSSLKVVDVIGSDNDVNLSHPTREGDTPIIVFCEMKVCVKHTHHSLRIDELVEGKKVLSSLESSELGDFEFGNDGKVFPIDSFVFNEMTFLEVVFEEVFVFERQSCSDQGR